MAVTETTASDGLSESPHTRGAARKQLSGINKQEPAQLFRQKTGARCHQLRRVAGQEGQLLADNILWQNSFSKKKFVQCIKPVYLCKTSQVNPLIHQSENDKDLTWGGGGGQKTQSPKQRASSPSLSLFQGRRSPSGERARGEGRCETPPAEWGGDGEAGGGARGALRMLRGHPGEAPGGRVGCHRRVGARAESCSATQEGAWGVGWSQGFSPISAFLGGHPLRVGPAAAAPELGSSFTHPTLPPPP